MATQLLFMSTEKNPETTRNMAGEIEGGKYETTSRQRGRKPSKNQGQKKTPQRGMGVAKLEHLRLQDRWKAITEATQFQPCDNTHFLKLPDPLNGIPLQYSKLGQVNYGFGGFVSDHVMVNPYGIGGFDQRVGISAYENSTELSSIPNLQCVSDPCKNCFKRRINEHEKGDKLLEMADMNGCHFFRSNRQYRQALISDFPTREAATSGYISSANHAEGVGEMGKQKMGMVYEYQFIPPAGKSGRDTNPNEEEEGAVAVEGSSYGVKINNNNKNKNSSNCIDLSLKLSF